MAVEQAAGRASLIDVPDRVLDQGIFVDAGARVASDEIDLRRESARVDVGDPLGDPIGGLAAGVDSGQGTTDRERGRAEPGRSARTW